MERMGNDMPTAVRALRLQIFLDERNGEPFRTADVARDIGISWDGAKSLLESVSLFVPLYREDDGCWRELRK